jgi:transposase-like protein
MEKRVSRNKQEKREYSTEFKRDVLRRMSLACNVSDLARELGIRRSLLYQWEKKAAGRLQHESGEPSRVVLQPPSEGEKELRDKIRWLEGALASQMAERDFFKGALQRIEARRQSKANSGEAASTTKFGS